MSLCVKISLSKVFAKICDTSNIIFKYFYFRISASTPQTEYWSGSRAYWWEEKWLELSALLPMVHRKVQTRIMKSLNCTMSSCWTLLMSNMRQRQSCSQLRAIKASYKWCCDGSRDISEKPNVNYEVFGTGFCLFCSGMLALPFENIALSLLEDLKRSFMRSTSLCTWEQRALWGSTDKLEVVPWWITAQFTPTTTTDTPELTSSKMQPHTMAYDWSDWAACVFSYKLRNLIQ